MAKHDPDRIAALAAGQLPPDEAAALESEIAGDPRAAADLAAQRLALAALRQAPLPLLTAAERTELRQRVAAALNLEESALTRVVTTRRRLPWRSLAVAAAALAVIAAVVPLVGLLSVGGDQAAMTTAAEDHLTARAENQESNAPLATAGAEDYSGHGDLAGALVTPERWTADGALALESVLGDPASLIASADAALTTCADEAAGLFGEQGEPAAALIHLASGDAIVWFVSPDGATLESLAVFDPADCSLLAAYP